MLNVAALSLLHKLHHMALHNALFSVLFFSQCTPLLSSNLSFIFGEHLSENKIIAGVRKCGDLVREGEILPSLTKSQHFLNPAILLFVHFVVSVLTSIKKKTASTIATSIVHSKLDYCNSFYHNLPNSQLHNYGALVVTLWTCYGAL